MTMFKKGMLFLFHQIHQINEGGIQVLPRKINKFFWSLFMSGFAPLAVLLGVHWSKAYVYIAKRNLMKLKKFRTQTHPNRSVIEKIMDQTLIYLRKVVDCAPSSVDIEDWKDACQMLGGLYFSQGDMGALNTVLKKMAELECSTVKSHQLSDLGIEFLPRYLAVGSIGNYEHLDVHVKAGMLGLRASKKMILLVDPGASVNNPCYLNYWKRYITVISDPGLIEMLAPLEKRLTVPFNSYMSLNGKMHKSFLALGIVRERWLNDKRLPLLTLSDEDYERGWQCLKSFGMRQGDWFVCLHVRERGWKDNNSPAEDFRNADIDTYQLAIKAVTDAGGWVIRMGDPTMKPLPQMPQVIDYAHSGAKSDWMDVFLCAQCRFFVGTSSGLFIFAMAFGTPIVATNFLPTCCSYYLTSQDLFIPRICRFRQKDRSLDFAELFSPALGAAAVQCIYDFNDVEIIANSQEEIQDLVGEMLERCQGRSQYGPKDEQLQERFKAMTAACGKAYGEENAAVNARIGRRFLHKHAALLSPETNIGSLIEK